MNVLIKDKTTNLENLAKVVRQKNIADVEIARIVGRPALKQSASNEGIDGHFTSGNHGEPQLPSGWYWDD